jgi:hypothetical protein
VQLDTTSGHETLAVDYLKKVLEARASDADVRAQSRPRESGCAAEGERLEAAAADSRAHRCRRRAAREVAVDPFGAVMKDGYIWGRGSKDDKPVLAANLMTMLMLKRRASSSIAT